QKRLAAMELHRGERETHPCDEVDGQGDQHESRTFLEEITSFKLRAAARGLTRSLSQSVPPRNATC
ncbi:MAG: hypothetical protein AAFQ82_17130, partial [Myxococcota bacterium]